MDTILQGPRSAVLTTCMSDLLSGRDMVSTQHRTIPFPMASHHCDECFYQENYDKLDYMAKIYPI